MENSRRMGKEIRLSQCMIVKNEEKNIRRALSWGKEIMWEQIVVDTGSTDRTVEIAQEMGAKVVYFPWIDDFAAAKNYAIEQAEGDWIAFLDADEYFTPEDVKKLLPAVEQLAQERYDAMAASWIQVDGSEDVLAEKTGEKLNWQFTRRADGSRGISLSGTQIRLFRRQPNLRYRGRVHEKLYVEHGELRCADLSQEFSILHTGYISSEMEEKKKVERNILLIKRELVDYPEDYRLMMYLGDSYFQQKKMEEAAGWYKQAAQALPENIGEDSLMGALIFKHLLAIYTDSSQEGELLEAYQEGIGRFPKEADFDYLMGRNYAGWKRYREAEGYLQRALGQLERYGSDGISVLLARNLIEAWELLVVCYYENGNLEACVSSAVTLLKADPWRVETLKIMLMAFKADEQRRENAASVEQVLAFLNNFYDLHQKETKDLVLEAAQKGNYYFELLQKFLLTI